MRLLFYCVKNKKKIIPLQIKKMSELRFLLFVWLAWFVVKKNGSDKNNI
jgi:hypothetical protein